jgi:REP element-mobilizing transposase RayT
MSFIDVHIQAVWSTKHREPLLEKSIRETLFDHILYNAPKKKIYIDCIGGYTDHLHTLILMSGDLSVSKTIQPTKPEHSRKRWMNY